MSTHLQTRKHTFIDIESLNVKIEVIFTNNPYEINKLINTMPLEYKEIIKNKNPNQDDYFFYTVDNNLKKYRIIITEEPDEKEMGDINCLCLDLFDDILETKGIYINPKPNEDRQLRNEIGSYICQRVWSFCKKI